MRRMGGSYERIAENGSAEYMMPRASFVLNYETQLTAEELANKQWHPMYLHLLVPADDDAWAEEELNAEAGVINGVKRLLVAQTADSEAKIEAVVQKMEGMNGKIDAKIERLEASLDAKMDTQMEGLKDEMHTKIDGLEGQISEMKGKMDENMAKILQKLEAHPLMR